VAAKKNGIRRILMPLFVAAILGLAAFLLYRTISRYSAAEILSSVQSFPLGKLGLAFLCAAGSYLCLTGFDTLALRYVGKPLPYPKTALASFTSLSLGHNIGLAAVSSGAIRYRFYSRWGLSMAEVAKLIVFCGVTVGLGLILLGGLAILLHPELAAKTTGFSSSAMIALAIACLAVCAGYLAMAALRKQPFKFRKWEFAFPSLPLAIGQLIIGPLNFAFVAGCLHQALSAAADVSYLQTATVYVIANVTSLISHVPGGLGIIESVVLLLVPEGQLIGALIIFRFVYFLVPLALGACLFAISEFALRKKQPERAVRSTAAQPA
jgi:glycosyltransferase 2 family protein